MDLPDYLRILRRNWMIVCAGLLVGLLAGAVLSFAMPRSYTANTKLFVAIQNSGSVQELQQGNTFTQARVQSYVQTATTPIVLQPAIQALGLDTSPEELAEQMKVSSQLNTVLISIEVSDRSPVQAAAIAQAVGDSLIKAVETLEKPRTSGASPVSLSVVAPAVAPESPSTPNTKLNLILGLLAGLALGLGTALARGLLDTRIRGEADLQGITSAPLLGGIAFEQAAVKKPLITQIAHQSPRAESFRTLRTNLKFANVSFKEKSLVLTSSLPGEGKSTTAANLAIALAQAGQTVCLVDADLRRPMIAEYLGLDQTVGLTSALVGTVEVDDVIQRWGEDDLYVITSGQVPPNPSELLGSREMRELVDRLEATFDIVVVDAPPLLPVTDAAVLAEHVGGVVVVVGVGKIRQQALERSMEALNRVGATVLGMVLNRLPHKGPDAYSYTYDGRPDNTTDRVESRSKRREDFRVRSSASSASATYEDSYREHGRSFFEEPVRTPSTYPPRRAGDS
ncbi:polysaccharide biosynthesis tyrosine autokinase [Paenarthrobacter ureafaciens]|nr:polysaccharide biosynthesis tyrosine autokinase [Paenarthrobacter ureafaciens]MEC3850820.1 polysaccharide biosynthesis tyrosine autokinase [Paenarthrobacter ureafaciens]